MVIYKAFKTQKSNYIYDRSTNSILKVSEDEFKYFEKNKVNTLNNYSLEKFQTNGYLKENIVVDIEHPSTSYIEYHINHAITDLILQVTQRCNLRCGYCVYSGNYLNREHTNKDMSFENAKRAIDFVLQRDDELKDIYFGFYGGEPLLKIDLIQQCVKYIKDNVQGKKIHFNVTTNGTLLTTEIAKFLMENNFDVLISLDGSKEEHDINRKYANNKGSFDDIVNNIKVIKKVYPEFVKKIGFNAVINPQNDYCKVKNFFDTDKLFCDADVTMNLIDDVNSKTDINFNDIFYVIQKFDKFKFYLFMLGKLDKENVPEYILKDKVRIADRYRRMKNKYYELGEKCHHNGPCMPGARRLFVNVEGKFFPCERVPETSQIMNIGSLDSGFNVEAIKALLNIGKLTKKECIGCWALPQCSICAKYAIKNGVLSKEEKSTYCESSKATALYNLKEICMLKEFGYNFEEVE